MQCQSCKTNTATIHLTEIHDGKRTEAHLCEECAQKEGVTIKNQIPLNELLSTLLSASPEVPDSQLIADEAMMDTACPSCGMTMGRFRKEMLLGCACDYDVFDKMLAPLVEKSQGGNTSHCGKIPSKLPSGSKKQIDVAKLQNQLDDAVKNEDYETAAKLRDQIGQLK
ncbi:MAG: UvrB/UvrC motif-containing protein [Planctomycetes bacterium]|nr:UvrB/UvrC motif-containing protein [Planctomycetota bacterium]